MMWNTLVLHILSATDGYCCSAVTHLRVYTEDRSNPSAAVTVLKPRHPLDPWSLCAPIQFIERSASPLHHHTPSVTAISFPSLNLRPSPPFSFILQASTPFLTHQPPSSPCSYPTALPSRSIPRPMYTEAYCAYWETVEGSIQSGHWRKKTCRAEIAS